MINDKKNEKDNDIIYDLHILNSGLNIKVKKSSFIGNGAYGNVYYIGNIMGINSVIKISKTNNSDDKFNVFEHEAYFYRKYKSNKILDLSKKNDRSLPILLDYGKTKNNIDDKIYSYIVLEYAGILSLGNLLKTKFIDYEEKMICKMIFNCLYNHIISFHELNLVYRDVSLSNVVISYDVTSFIISRNYRVTDKIDQNLIKLIPENISIDNIMENYIHKNYGKIVKFVDSGMFGDLDFIHKNDVYDRTNFLFHGDFREFDALDGMFAATPLYVSPFCLFNLSFIINNYEDEQMTKNIKNLVVTVLRMADIWSLCIGYAIHIYDTNNKSPYRVMINSKIKKNPISYSKNHLNGTTENTFNYMPFLVVDNDIILLVKELDDIIDLEMNLINKDYTHLRETISIIITEILSFANLILTHSVKRNVSYELYFDDSIINILYKESIKKINFIHSVMNRYDNAICEEIFEYLQHN
jgi:serine/threonine protein kinase